MNVKKYSFIEIHWYCVTRSLWNDSQSVFYGFRFRSTNDGERNFEELREKKIDTITKSCWLSFHCLYLITQSPIFFSFQSIHPFALDYMIITNRMYVHRRTIASNKNKLRLLINWLCVYAFLALNLFISLLSWWWNEEEWRR